MQDVQKAVWSIPYVFVAFSKFKTEFLLHIVLLKCQIAFSKFPRCDNQVLVGCIPIPAADVDLNLKSLKLVSHLIRCIAITFWNSRVYDNCKCPYEKCLETYHMHHIYICVCVCVCVRRSIEHRIFSFLLYQKQFCFCLVSELMLFLKWNKSYHFVGLYQNYFHWGIV